MLNVERDGDALYLRKSQADVEAEKINKMETLARHKKILLELADKQGLNIVKIYEEIVSGETISERPQMQQLLNDVYSKKYKSVVVMEIERLARGATKDQGEVADAFKYSQTLIVTPTKTFDPTNEFDEEYFEFGLYMSRREYKTIRRRMQAGRLQSVREGNFLGAPPYGYDVLKRGKNDRTLVPNHETEYVKMMFDWFVNDRMTCGQIGQRLTRMGVKTRKNRTEWHRSTVRDILSNHIYTGKMRWHRRKMSREYDGSQIKKVNRRVDPDDYLLIDGKHDAIIDQELFDRAQLIFAEIPPVKFDKTIVNIFAGLLKCKDCGKSMLYQAYNGRPTRPRLVHGESILCKPKSAIYEDVVNAFIFALKREINNFDVLLEGMNNGANRATYERNLALYEQQLASLENTRRILFENLEDGTYSKDEFRERKAINDQKIEAIKLELDQLEPPREDEITNKLVSFHAVLDSLNNDQISPTEKNILLKSIINRIEYSNNNDAVVLDVHFE